MGLRGVAAAAAGRGSRRRQHSSASASASGSGSGSGRERATITTADGIEIEDVNIRRPRKVALAVAGLAAVAFLPMWLAHRHYSEDARALQRAGLRYHGEHVPFGGGRERKHWLSEKEQLAALALQAAGDPHGESLRQTMAQVESFVALFIEACPVDGPTYCGTYRVQLPITEGEYPVYKNQHGRVLYRNTIKHMWVIIDRDEYVPDLSYHPELPGTQKVHSLLPTTAVPLGSNIWSWGSLPPASYHELVEKGVIKSGFTQMLRNELTLTVTGLIDEDEVARFEAYAEEQLEMEVEAGDVDASSVSAGGTEGEARPPMNVYLEVPFDVEDSLRLKLVLRSGAGAEFGISGDAQASVGQLINIGDLMLSDIDIPPDPPPKTWGTNDRVDGPILRCGENDLACYGWQEKGSKKIGKWVQLWSNHGSDGGAMMAA